MGFNGRIDGREFSIRPTELASVMATPVVSFSVEQDSKGGLLVLIGGGVAIAVFIVSVIILRRKRRIG